jgi:hypothetical protein
LPAAGSGILVSADWGIDISRSCAMPKLTVSWDENGPLLQTAEVENPVSDRRWSAPVGQLTQAERQELLSAAQALAQLIADLAAEDTFFRNPR